MDVMTENKVVPKLRFKLKGEEWFNKKIGDICIVKTGSKDTQDRKESGKYPFFVRSNTVEKIDSFSFDGEAILTSGDGVGVGKNFHYINDKFDYHQRVYSLHTFKEGFSGKFIFQVFKQKFYRRVMRLSAKNSVDSVRMSMITDMEIAFPSLPEQQKIASFLSAVDKKLQQLTKKKSLLEEYKKGVMQKIFSQELRFKDEFGNNYPDWEEKKLGEVGETFNGLTGKTKVDFGRGKPFIQYMQIFNSAKIDTSKFGYVDISEGEKQKTAKYGDVFFTTSSETPLEIGYASVLTEEIEEVYLNSFCFGYRPNSLTELYPDFSSYLFRSEFLRKQIVKLAQGSTRYNMSKVQLMKVLIQIPSLDEQQKIANFLSVIDKKIDLVRTQIENNKAFKKGLLQQMFV